jgi:hypothetical protein
MGKLALSLYSLQPRPHKIDATLVPSSVSLGSIRGQNNSVIHMGSPGMLGMRVLCDTLMVLACADCATCPATNNLAWSSSGSSSRSTALTESPSTRTVHPKLASTKPQTFISRGLYGPFSSTTSVASLLSGASKSV